MDRCFAWIAQWLECQRVKLETRVQCRSRIEFFSFNLQNFEVLQSHVIVLIVKTKATEIIQVV